jgi:hypothetical protein
MTWPSRRAGRTPGRRTHAACRLNVGRGCDSDLILAHTKDGLGSSRTAGRILISLRYPGPVRGGRRSRVTSESGKQPAGGTLLWPLCCWSNAIIAESQCTLQVRCHRLPAHRCACGRRDRAMWNDFAALIPPFVVAAAFIAGVVALLRREMAPRRRRAHEVSSADMSGSGTAGSSRQPQLTRPDQAGDDARGADTGDATGADTGSPGSGKTSAGSSDLTAQDERSGS